MTKKFLTLALSALMLNLCGVARVHAATKDKARESAASGANAQAAGDAKAAEKIEKAKKRVAEIGGSGRKELVAVNLREQPKQVGYISEVAEDHFTLTDSKNGVALRINYADVTGIRRTRLTADNMKVLSYVGVGLMALFVVGVFVAASRE